MVSTIVWQRDVDFKQDVDFKFIRDSIFLSFRFTFRSSAKDNARIDTTTERSPSNTSTLRLETRQVSARVKLKFLDGLLFPRNTTKLDGHE